MRTCLLGAPLTAAETAPLRFRRLQLRSLGLSDAARTSAAGKLWPLSCRDAAGRALDVLKATSNEADQKALSGLVTFLSDGASVSKDATQALSAVMPVLDAASHTPIAAAREPLPELALNADSLANVVGLSKKGLSHSFTEENPGLSLPVLIQSDDAPAPIYCSFRADVEAADCRSLSELSSVRGHGLRLLGTSDPDSPSLVFAGQRGKEGVFVTGSGEPIDRMYSYGGYSTHDGAVSILGWDEDKKTLVLTQKLGSAAATRTPLKPNFRVGNFFYGSQLLWDSVFVRGITPSNERRLFVLPLAQRDGSSFGLVDIGELAEPGLIRPGEEQQPHITGCRTQAATVVRVRGEASDFLTFRINGKFTSPVETASVGVLGCHGTTATVVSTHHAKSRGTRILHDACTSAGCVRRVLKGEALDGDASDLSPREPSDLAAVDLDGKLLVVWIAGEQGALRMRIGDPDQFARSPAKVIFDDHILAGKPCRDTTILGFRLYSREHFAVLILSTLAGLHAFRIDPSGAIKPWPLTIKP
ncbi:MAG: hypothetical protein QM756_42950 [Polyangiaceae bacterium]